MFIQDIDLHLIGLFTFKEIDKLLCILHRCYRISHLNLKLHNNHDASLNLRFFKINYWADIKNVFTKGLQSKSVSTAATYLQLNLNLLSLCNKFKIVSLFCEKLFKF